MRQADVVVAGAGPAGIAAAIAAAEHGLETLVLDDNAAAGGQIWRAGVPAPNPDRLSREGGARADALRRLHACGATVLTGCRVFDAGSPATLYAVREQPGNPEVVEVRYKKLVIATGARERFLPFPGWTLPGVFGAGGLQALVKGGYPVGGKRVVVAGSGPLLLAVAAHLREYGAQVVCVAEQAPLARMAVFAASLWSQPQKIRQGIGYRIALGTVPYRTGCWPVAAYADPSTHRLAGIELTDGHSHWNYDCDLIACGFHLVPNTELAVLLECELQEGFVVADAGQKTSVAEVYCAGEPTGIGGLEAALLQGEIAGLSCAGRPAAGLRRRNAREKAFAARLQATFALRPELRSLARPETIVCRCEDVAYRSLTGRGSWTDAKLQTRCGMGPCQGRICGPATEALFGWKMGSIRPPLFPVPVSALCRAQSQQEPH